MQHVDYGLGVFNKAAFATVPDHAVYDLAAVYQTLVSQDQLAAYEVTERFYEMGSPAGLAELESLLQSKSP
jgi:NDP-sugar pyrophosphorylase family protein